MSKPGSIYFILHSVLGSSLTSRGQEKVTPLFKALSQTVWISYVPLCSEHLPWGGSPGHPGASCSWKGRLDERQREPAALLTNHYILLQHPVHIPPKFSPILAGEIFLQEKLQPVSKTAGQGKRPKRRSRSGWDPLHVLMSCSGSKTAFAPRAGTHQELGDTASCSEPTSR